MDYKTCTKMQQNPSLNPNSATDPYAQNPYSTQNYYYSHPQNPNPNPSIDPQNPHEAQYIPTLVQLSGSEPYQAVGSYALSHCYTYQQTADGTTVVDSSAYSQDSSLVVENGAVAADHYGVNHYATNLVPGSSDPNFWTYPANHPRKTGNWKKGPKKIKVVQSVWCEICSVECNAKDVLELHKLGRKHLRNLEKLKGVSASGPPTALASSSAPVASVTSDNPIIGPQENPDKTKSKARKKPSEPPEDLETKRKKVLEGGAAADAVRTCALCNVVCNSETVFKYHLAGQKHASMVKKHASSTGVAAAAM